MIDTVPKRPPTLPATCVYLGGLSAILCFNALAIVTRWNGDEGATRVKGQLAAMRDAGMSRGSAESSYQVFLTVLAILAAAGVVFAVYTSRGDRHSRLGLTIVLGIVGVVTFFGAMGNSFFLALLGAMAVAFSGRLWTGDVRTYFRGLKKDTATPASGAPQAVPERPNPFEELPPSPPPVQEPVQPPVHYPYPPLGPPPGYYQPFPPPPVRERLPRTVHIAAWTAFGGSVAIALVSVFVLLGLALIGNDYERIVREGGIGTSLIRDSGMDYDTMYRLSFVVAGICLVLAIGGLVGSLMVLTKKRSGDVVLFVMTVVTLIVSVLGFPPGLPWTAAAIVCLVHLRKPESRAWFART